MAKQNQNPKTSWWQQFVKDKSWYEPLRRNFWNNTNRLRAVKATFAIALLVVPFVILGKPFIAVSLGLGALAGALSETDDHPKGRIKSLALKVFSFGLASLSVSILLPYPVLFGLGLALSTIVFIVIGGLGERYRGVTFGALLVGIYAMLGADISPAWYWQPILLPGGALFYGILSLALLYYRPWRLLEEQLARGYMELSKYLDQKAGLFPSDERMQRKIRNQLALQNVQLVGALDRCKEVLNSYGDALKDDEPLKPYLRYFMLLQSLHERASSSHERYDLLSSDPANRELLEGIGQSLHLLSRVTKRVAESLLTGTPYRHSVSLEWVVKALQEKFDKQGLGDTHPLALLINNLSRSIVSLKNLTDDQQRTMAPRLAKDTRTLAQRLKEQLNWNHPRMRHAIRLALCFLISYAISEGFGIVKGEWIVLTGLFVCQPSYSETRRRLFQRVLGTLTGVVGGVLIVQLLPTLPGQVLLMLGAAYAFFIWLRKNYAVAVVFITIFVLAIFNIIANKGMAVMLPRLIDTMIGATVAIITVRLLWPDWQYKKLPGLLATALDKNVAYFQAIINEYKQRAIDDDLDYRIARREAHRADNALVLAWQDMQVEPKKHQLFREQAFSLTYLNHALLSYLSAFGAHREKQNVKQADVINFANELLNLLRTAQSSMTMNQMQDEHRIPKMLEEIRERTSEIDHGTTKQQFTMLYNIAEVMGQILEQANAISANNKK